MFFSIECFTSHWKHFQITVNCYYLHLHKNMIQLTRQLFYWYSIKRYNDWYHYPKSSKGWVQMFPLSSYSSLLINKATLRCNLNWLFSGMRIEKSLSVALWPSNKIWSLMTDFLGLLTCFCVSRVISRCSNIHTKLCLSVSP